MEYLRLKLMCMGMSFLMVTAAVAVSVDDAYNCIKDKTQLWLEQTALQVHSMEGYFVFKIPTLIVSPKNKVLAIFEGRVGGHYDETETRIVMRKSADLGKTWGPLKVIYKESGDDMTIGNPVPVVDHETGVIWLFFCRNNLDVLMTKSEDDGLTWSTPTDMTVQLRKPNQKGFYATGPGHGIQLKYGDQKGRLVIPAYARENTVETDKVAHRSFIIYSDDHGSTWKTGQSTHALKPNYSSDGAECMVVELPDSSLYMTIRNNHGTFEGGGYRCYARSFDAGETWTGIDVDRSLPESICQASIIDFKTPKGEDAVLFCGPAVVNRSRWNKDARKMLTFKISYDGCQTWPISKTLFFGPSAYSDIVVLPDGSFGCLFEKGYKTYDDELVFARFSYEWLIHPNIAYD
jgi:sialidase-1